jgi:hypothetical protein
MQAFTAPQCLRAEEPRTVAYIPSIEHRFDRRGHLAGRAAMDSSWVVRFEYQPCRARLGRSRELRHAG